MIFNLSGKKMSLTELMKELQAFESMIKGKGIKVSLIEAGTSSKPNNGKGKKIKQVACKVSSNPSSTRNIKKQKNKNPKKAKCFACGNVVHFKKDYKVNPAKKGE